MIGYVKCFDSSKAISAKVNDNRLLKKYTMGNMGMSQQIIE